MSFGSQLLAWRRHRELTQSNLAEKAAVPRPYLSKLELDKADPSLSLLRRLAVALDIGIGQLIEDAPETKALSNEELDGAARGALRPGLYTAGAATPFIRPLSRLLKERRASLGLYKPRGEGKSKSLGIHAMRRMRADLGEGQWKALLKRIDKHATFMAPRTDEDK